MVVSLLKRALMMSTPLLFGSIAEVVAERSGMMVTAIEGIFLMGAWGGFVGTYITGNAFIGILCAILAGVAAAAVYGVVCIYLKQHQVVTGTAINVLAAGICTYLQRVFFGVPTTPLKIPAGDCHPGAQQDPGAWTGSVPAEYTDLYCVSDYPCVLFCTV